MKNLPDFSWITDKDTREYCENNFVNDETLELLRQPGNILCEHPPGQLNPNGFMCVYNTNEDRYLLHGPIDK